MLTLPPNRSLSILESASFACSAVCSQVLGLNMPGHDSFLGWIGDLVASLTTQGMRPGLQKVRRRGWQLHPGPCRLACWTGAGETCAGLLPRPTLPGSPQGRRQASARTRHVDRLCTGSNAPAPPAGLPAVRALRARQPVAPAWWGQCCISSRGHPRHDDQAAGCAGPRNGLRTRCFSGRFGGGPWRPPRQHTPQAARVAPAPACLLSRLEAHARTQACCAAPTGARGVGRTRRARA